MVNKLSKDISGSVQEKRGMLYLVVSYKDTVTQKNKTKWLGLGLPAGSTKSLINKAVREAKNKFESEYKRFLDGYDDPTKFLFCLFSTTGSTAYTSTRSKSPHTTATREE